MQSGQSTFPLVRTQADSITIATDVTAQTPHMTMQDYIAQEEWNQTRAADRKQKISDCQTAGGLEQYAPDSAYLKAMAAVQNFDIPGQNIPIEIEQPTGTFNTSAIGCMLLDSDLPKTVPAKPVLTLIPNTCSVAP